MKVSDESEYIKSNITYFLSFGHQNVNETLSIVSEKVKNSEIRKVLIFAATKESVYKLKSLINDTKSEILAVSFPANTIFYEEKENGEKEEIIPETSQKDIKNEFKENGIILVQGIMPFQEIILPGVIDYKISVLTNTLSLISKSLPLCIEAILMCCDGGFINEGEDVIVMSADTAIVARACNKKFLFHPKKGLIIKEILCKPLC